MISPTLYITFYTTAEAMATECAARAAGLDGRLVPIPRALSAGCGIAWSCDPALEKALLSLLADERIEWETAAVLPH